MVVHDLYVVGVAVLPSEAYPPLVINSDTVLAQSVALQCFQLIPWRQHEILKCPCTMEVEELAPCLTLECLEPCDPKIVKESCRVPTSK